MVTEQQAKSSPWDVFINLLAVIALYAVIWSVGTDDGRPRATGANSFDVCADFALKDYDVRRTVYVWVPESDGGYNSAWNHDAGHVCFTRTIDPSRNPPCSGSPTTR